MASERKELPIANWQLKQLTRLALHDPKRAEVALNAIWSSQPDLFGELAIAAVDQEQLTVDACAELLSCSTEVVEAKLVEFRHSSRSSGSHAVVRSNACAARVPESGVAVWEIVREYRRFGSWDRLLEAFPSVNINELSMALEYAKEHPAEIEAAIEHYEGMLAKRRTLYPFTR